MLETRNTPKYPHIPRRRQICPAARDHGSLERVRLFEAQDALPVEPLAAQRLAAFELAETRKQKRPGQDSGSRLRCLLDALCSGGFFSAFFGQMCCAAPPAASVGMEDARLKS